MKEKVIGFKVGDDNIVIIIKNKFWFSVSKDIRIIFSCYDILR